MKVLIVGNYSRNLVIFRGALIKTLYTRGHSILCVGPEDDEWVRKQLHALGAKLYVIPMARSSLNLLHDISYFIKLAVVIRQARPDVIVTFTHKPNCYAALANGLVHRCPHIGLIEGLGYSFIDAKGMKRLAANLLVRVLYGMAFRLMSGAVFLNRDDVRELSRYKLRPPSLRCLKLPGIGIDLDRFAYTPARPAVPMILMVSRLLRTKGVAEYCEAAEMVRRRFPNVIFTLVGAPDPGADGVPTSFIEEKVKQGILEWHGACNDVLPHYQRCFVYVLPSYREGFPVTVMEAMGVGRPVIATDVAGCRDAVQHERTGIIIPAKNASALADAIITLLSHPERSVAMGLAGRRVAEACFNDDEIAGRQVNWIEALGKPVHAV